MFREDRPLDLERIEDFLSTMVQTFGTQMMRYKGVLNIHKEHRRVVFQGVHMLMGSEAGQVWKKGETRSSKIVFIGKNLPRELIEAGLAQCVSPAATLLKV